MTLLKLLSITACCHLVGTAGLAAVMSGPELQPMLGSVLFSPLLAIAGWPMAVLILLLVSLMWGVYAQHIVRRKFVFVLVGTLVGAGIGVLLSASNLSNGTEPRGLAYFVGCVLAGTLSNGMILLLFGVQRANDRAATDDLTGAQGTPPIH